MLRVHRKVGLIKLCVVAGQEEGDMSGVWEVYELRVEGGNMCVGWGSGKVPSWNKG